MKLLSLIFVKNPVLDPSHLNFVIDALNQQTDIRFNTFWIDQTSDSEPLRAQLQAACFDYHILHTPGPVVGEVICWELVQPFAYLMEHPAMLPFFTYLHMECIPEYDFVGRILECLPEIQAQLGPRFICMLQQLSSSLQLGDLHVRHYMEQLRLSELYTWTPGLIRDYRMDYQQYSQYAFAWFEEAWKEDLFLMPTALARELQLFSAVKEKLYFQDIYDIFRVLFESSYTQHIRWVRIPGAVTYHLLHPRVFFEFRQPFLQAVRQHPELFAHCGLYDVAFTDFHYEESDVMRLNGTVTSEIIFFYTELRWGAKGCMTLWKEALDRMHLPADLQGAV